MKIVGNHGHNILRLFDTLQILFSAQVKRIVIISKKHGIYELIAELLNNLESQKFRKDHENLSTSKNYKLVPSTPHQSKTFLILAKNKSKLSGIALFQIKTRVCLMYFVHDCLWKEFSSFNSHQASSKFIFVTNLVSMRLLKHFQLQSRKTNLPKRPNFCLTWITT